MLSLEANEDCDDPVVNAQTAAMTVTFILGTARVNVEPWHTLGR